MSKNGKRLVSFYASGGRARRPKVSVVPPPLADTPAKDPLEGAVASGMRARAGLAAGTSDTFKAPGKGFPHAPRTTVNVARPRPVVSKTPLIGGDAPGGYMSRK